jgi:hypothetical protein
MVEEVRVRRDGLSRAIQGMALATGLAAMLLAGCGGGGGDATPLLGASPSSTRSEQAVPGGTDEGLKGAAVLRSDSGEGPTMAADRASGSPQPGGPPYRLRAAMVQTQTAAQLCAVTAVAGVASSPADSVQAVCSPRVEAPPPPANVSVGYDLKSLRFSWTPSPGATYYQLLDNTLMWTMPDFFVTRVNNITATSYQLSDLFLPQFANLKFVISACNAGGCSSSQPVVPDMKQAIGYFKAGDTATQRFFGYAVALSFDGKWMAVGAPGILHGSPTPAPGAVHVYARIGTGWSLRTTLSAPNPKPGDGFGTAVAFSSNAQTLAIGASNDDGAPSTGAVYVFANGALGWTQQALLKPFGASTTAIFGHSVSLSSDGNLLAAGAISDSSGADRAGAAYVFSRTGASWSPQAQLLAASPQSISMFGSAIAMSADGSTVAVGARNETVTLPWPPDTSLQAAGAVHVFRRSGNAWPLHARLTNQRAYSNFGSSVALSHTGNVLAVGAPTENSMGTGINPDTTQLAVTSGAAFVYWQLANTWNRGAYIKAPSLSFENGFGEAVALSGDGRILAVGAPGDAATSAGVNGTETSAAASFRTGAVHLYGEKTPNIWSRTAFVKAPNPDAMDAFGYAVSLDAYARTLAVGAIWEGSAATGVGGNQQDNSAPAAGAVYVY